HDRVAGAEVDADVGHGLFPSSVVVGPRSLNRIPEEPGKSQQRVVSGRRFPDPLVPLLSSRNSPRRPRSLAAAGPSRAILFWHVSDGASTIRALPFAASRVTAETPCYLSGRSAELGREGIA